MSDPYKILGVNKDASDAEVKKAYRKLAKQYHPDNAKGDKRAQAKFSEATTAYDLLSDKEKRRAFDRGEIDADGNPSFQGFGPFGRGGGGARTRHAGAQHFRAEDIFSELFGGMRTEAPQPQRRGADTASEMTISLAEAALGAKRAVNLANGKKVNVTIKPGMETGQQIRLKGQGLPSPGGGPAGDALITVKVRPDPLFTRDGRDIRVHVPVTLYEAVLGAKIRVPTLSGAIELTIPAWSSSGRVLRLKGKGVAAANAGGQAGDLLVVLRIVLPESEDDGLSELMRKWRSEKPYDPRGPSFGNN